ncbi:Potassium channel subfamily T member 2 like protein [Argiope bruennichi]|uniref:Potassium channel subfamily T member 2 like protein n=1 Tax=Argiope bruennichi TaxID=94029 RepID=A0A8T0F9B5_ARGBR|nr:Potassium channel subfamily T member 2 like protein [Argiope bruennichi]
MKERKHNIYPMGSTQANARAVLLRNLEVRVEFYVNENNVKERLQLYFFKNQSSSLKVRIFTLVIKLLLCLLYGCDPVNITIFRDITPDQEINYNDMRPRSNYINWNAVIWVDRPLTLWIFQTVLAIVSLSEALLLVYLGYKGNIWHHLFSFNFTLELVNNVPFIATIFWSPLRNLFIPSFLNCWLAKFALEHMFHDLHRAMQRSQSALSHRLMILSATLLCLIFTSRHRAQNERHVVVCSTTLRSDTVMDFLNEFYAHPLLQDYYVVLLSPCELDATMKMILQIPMWAQRVIYIQGSALKDLDLARARMNAAEACFILAARNYADRSAADEHTILRSWAVRDFAPSVPQYVQIFRPENKVHVAFAEHVVCEDEFKYALLANNCLCPGTSTLVTLLLHTSRGQEGQMSAEEWHRIYGKCSGNEIYHIRLGDSRFFGEYEGKPFTLASFHSHRKYGVTLVGVKTEMGGTWPILLNPGPNYILKASDICFYMNITKEENSAFLPAEHTLKRESLVGLNPDPTPDSSSTQENETVMKAELKGNALQARRFGSHLQVPLSECIPQTMGIGLKRSGIVPVVNSFAPPGLHITHAAPDGTDDAMEAEQEKYLDIPWVTPAENCEILRGFPPVTPYVGVSPTFCYLLKNKKPLCCLQLSQVCDHCTFRTAKNYNWPNRCIILAADYASNGIYNFIVPLRAHFHSPQTLRPIVLLLEKKPHPAFLDAISWFPLVYWMLGSIDDLDDLLRAGINLADSVVVVNKESSNSAEEDYLADCNTIVAVQTMFKLFPSVRIITELSQSCNMRFMQFRARDAYALHLSKMEKREKDRGSHISYMFRLPFAAGSVFSASMLDTLLYQAFVKDYMITFVRLLLGVDQAPGSGFLSSIRITKDDLWIKTYGRLYQKLSSTTYEIPIGVYRTQKSTLAETSSMSLDLMDDEDQIAIRTDVERQEIGNLVRNRMKDLCLPTEDYDDCSEKRNSLSYVVINPSCDLTLEEGDVIYVIRPSPIWSKKVFLTRGSIRIKSPNKLRRQGANKSTEENLPGSTGDELGKGDEKGKQGTTV